MTSSATTTQLGRQLWGSIRDSATVLATKLPTRPSPSSAAGQCSFFFNTPPQSAQHTTTRFFHSARRFFFPQLPYPARISPQNVRKSCTSGGLLLLGLSSSPSSTSTVVTTCTAAADSALAGSPGQRANLSYLARQIWNQQSRHGRNGSGKQDVVAGKRSKSSNGKGNGNGNKRSRAASTENSTAGAQKPKPKTSQQPPAKSPIVHDPAEPESLVNSMSKYLHLPNMPHRPTKEELLAAASGFRQRLRVRFKWFSIRSMRPWNADEWGAFVSWFLFGHLVWILVGTTTFFSLVILTINTVFAQETLAKWIGDYLTQSAGLTVVFESAIVPKWRDNVITFRNVFVSRRPGQGRSTVQKGSSNAAAEAAAARLADPDAAAAEEEDDGNYTQFDVTIDTVDVTLSFIKWWNGKGLLKDVEVKGVRGVVDRTSVQWSAEGLDPHDYRHEHNPGDFELDHFKMEDLLVTVHQPHGFRPFSVSIFSCDLPQLRKQWLFYDFLSASHISGAYDGSLFTIHPRQIHGVASGGERRKDEFADESVWKKFSRLRIDGLKIDHLNRGVEGPFGWIYEGNVDIVADVMFPTDPEEGIGKVVAEFYDKMEEAVTSNRYIKILEDTGNRSYYKFQNGVIRNYASGINFINSDNDNDNNNTKNNNNGTDPANIPPSSPLEETLASPSSPATPFRDHGLFDAGDHHDDRPHHQPPEEETPSYLVMDLRIHLNDVRAAVPLFNNPHMSYVNQALVRPIVAYINAKRTYIPVNCRIVKRLTDFDGSWTVWDSGLMDDTGAEVYSAFARSVEDQQSRVRRFKRVGLWTVSLIVHALLAGVAGELA
ncbi:mitochondrial distribution and morphology proteins-domain-containing protein [Dichotomopilus funicola]|uniref:Mitochondrial distribution and morphology proteins-domain-containing protein n=1 Tax=Dichotomopilus funicola TaxID=1934379 RepID=A0AAN6ZJY9_9PEZI|nr:mitochondrial distribution and morphology proteins-domain-containing protein [Dichotomopilus funicola]